MLKSSTKIQNFLTEYRQSVTSRAGVANIDEITSSGKSTF